MSSLIQRERTHTSEEQYEMLKKTLAHYLLLQVDTFITGAGIEALAPAMNILTDKKAALKVREITESGQQTGDEAVKALSQNLADSMGKTFNSDYNIETGDSFRKVTLTRCGCIESVTTRAEEYNLTKPQVRGIFCGSCMSSYKKAATTLNLGFKGKLSGEGCMMNFSTK